MLAAEFGYNKPYCDLYMDLDEFIAHIQYHHKNPPAGTILLGVVKALGGKKDESPSDPSRMSEVFTPEVREKLKNMSSDEKFKYLSTLPLTKDQMTASRSLEGFMGDFKSIGGELR